MNNKESEQPYFKENSERTADKRVGIHIVALCSGKEEKIAQHVYKYKKSQPQPC